MTRRLIPGASLGLAVAGLACWMLMFAAGTDIWHDTGRPDPYQIAGAHPTDVRAFALAFYLLVPVLLVQVAVAALGFVRARRTA
jgi:hypothetical protein